MIRCDAVFASDWNYLALSMESVELSRKCAFLMKVSDLSLPGNGMVVSVITCHVLMRLAHGSSNLYFTDFSTSVLVL
jgi:hypothetical protein